MAAVAVAFPSTAFAASIAEGDTVDFAVLGTASIYQIFGHSGGGGPVATDAILTTFAAGGENVFTFAASGTINCCNQGFTDPLWGPDGSAGPSAVGGLNGLSGIDGDARIPLVGVFTTDTDPFNGIAPATLDFDKDTASSLAPLLNQVFYIGDGLSGFNDAGGARLTFAAPSDATRLYLGVADSFLFNGTSGYYGDNPGQFDVSVSLGAASGAVPEPATWAMMAMGFGALGTTMRASRRRRATLAQG